MNVLIFTVWPFEFWKVPKSQVERLRERFPQVIFTHALTDAEALSAIESAEVALASRLSPAMVEEASRLRWVHSTAAAVGILPLKELAARSIAVTNSRGVQAAAMAEFVIGGVLVVAAPFIAETDRLIGADRLAMLSNGAVVINVARGRIIDEAALIAALQNGHLGGAVLDVFEQEPLKPESPLWTLPNVIISPHVSGVRPDHWAEVIDLFGENLERFQRGEPLLNLVDVQAGY